MLSTVPTPGRFPSHAHASAIRISPAIWDTRPWLMPASRLTPSWNTAHGATPKLAASISAVARPMNIKPTFRTSNDHTNRPPRRARPSEWIPPAMPAPAMVLS